MIASVHVRHNWCAVSRIFRLDKFPVSLVCRPSAHKNHSRKLAFRVPVILKNRVQLSIYLWRDCQRSANQLFAFWLSWPTHNFEYYKRLEKTNK